MSVLLLLFHFVLIDFFFDFKMSLDRSIYLSYTEYYSVSVFFLCGRVCVCVCFPCTGCFVFLKFHVMLIFDYDYDCELGIFYMMHTIEVYMHTVHFFSCVCSLNKKMFYMSIFTVTKRQSREAKLSLWQPPPINK